MSWSVGICAGSPASARILKIAAALTSVCLLFAPESFGQPAPVWRLAGAKLLIDVPLAPKDFPEPVAALVFDGSGAYLAAPDGLYTLDRSLAPESLRRLAFAGTSVRNVYVHEGALYVLTMTSEAAGPATDHGFFRSTDGGATFVPLDDALEECIGNYCRYLTAGEAIFAGTRIFTNAGGSVIVTDDGGETWHALQGTLQQQACYDPTMHLDGTRLFIGGECPLDMAYVRMGILDTSGTAWGSEPANVATPPLGNRKIQFIRRRDGTGDFFIGTEGGLLRSTDAGESFDWSLFWELDSTRGYPYVSQFLLAPSMENSVIVAGFDKATMEPWLAISSDGGTHWLGGSAVLRSIPGYEFSTVVFLAADSAGRILAGLLEAENRRLAVVELMFARGGRARPVRR